MNNTTTAIPASPTDTTVNPVLIIFPLLGGVLAILFALCKYWRDCKNDRDNAYQQFPMPLVR